LEDRADSYFVGYDCCKRKRGKEKKKMKKKKERGFTSIEEFEAISTR